jgi:hypothetical protein
VNNVESFLSDEEKQHYVLVGTDTLFRTRVTVSDGKHATVTSCDDSSKTTLIDTRTGTLDPSQPSDQFYALSIWEMTWVAGHWTISSVKVVSLPAAGARPCQPATAQ